MALPHSLKHMILACGPFFREDGLWASLAIFLVIKPLAYYAFIQAFRYRVSRPIPMTVRQAIKLTVGRALLGVLLTGGGAGILYAMQSETLYEASWVYLYCERLFSWWLIGSRWAGLRGRRLVGWIISGTAINAAFDFSVLYGVFAGLLYPGIGVAAIIVFIAILHVIGRRDSLKIQFSGDPFCKKCQYNLTGNISGICPECGTPVILPGSAAQVREVPA